MFLAGLALLAGMNIVTAGWKPADGPLMTRWAKQITPPSVWQEYPRPQMVRKDWTNLNGLWDYAITGKDAGQPEKWDGEILVPFCVESALSGVMKPVQPDQALWYHRSIPRPELKEGTRMLLHFGAVDWHTTVWVNGDKAGEHKGGYDPFTFDITDAIGTTKSTRDDIFVRVWDPTRLVNNASGWTDRKTADVLDVHRYPGPASAPLEEDRAVVLGEFGGLGLQVDGHMWKKDKNWGYRSFKDAELLTAAYVNLLKKLRPLIADGLTAAVYTQTSDVEIEVNGLMTYDREIVKIDTARAAKAAGKLYQPPPKVGTLAPSPRVTPQSTGSRRLD